MTDMKCCPSCISQQTEKEKVYDYTAIDGPRERTVTFYEKFDYDLQSKWHVLTLTTLHSSDKGNTRVLHANDHDFIIWMMPT